MPTQLSSMWNGHLSKISIAKHVIKLLPNLSPVHSAPYQASCTVQKLLRLEIEKMLFQNVVKSEQTEWAPIFFVPKKDRSVRFVFECRKLNILVRQYLFPIPGMDECLNSVGEATFRPALDANSKY